MEFAPTKQLPEVVLVTPEVKGDARGFFLESWHASKFAAGGVDAKFVQDNHSRSVQGVLRGLHAQLDPAQGKLVRCVAGEVFDVAVDIRRGSPTFGQHASARLSAENFQQLWIPPGFAHGFCVLSESADVQYKCSAPYRPEGEIAIAWNDPEIGIAWPIADPRVSDRDRAAPGLSAQTEALPRWAGA